MTTLPTKAISIMQPWAWLIVKGYKNIENRDWRTAYRGPVAIHAGRKRDIGAWRDVTAGYHPVTGERAPEFDHDHTIDLLGGIVGVAEIVDCIPSATSEWRPEYQEWFVGKYGFVIRNAEPIPFIPVKGALGFFDWQGRRL